MKKIFIICLAVFTVGSLVYGSVLVTEERDGETWTYTLTNNSTETIWNWAVWFSENPGAFSVTTTLDGWVCTNLDTQGYFPEEYVAKWGDEVTNSEGEPLIGPEEEPGFYHAYAGNFTSANPKEYDDSYDAWLGSKFGWDGYDADIKTSCGIGPGQTGTLIVETVSMPETEKSFSYNTTDYWYSKMCLSNEDLAFEFEKHGTVILYNTNPTTVTETYNSEDGTYIYKLTNNGTKTIYNWAVWFTENPGATAVTTDDGWVCPFAQHGYFPAEYTDVFSDVDVLGSNGQPLVGPDGEGGFYQVYAYDFVSANPKEYDKEVDVLIGGESGWDGYDADIRTILGIGPGETGTLTIKASSMPATAKSFSFNTVDYWYSMISMDGPTITTIWCDFEVNGTVE